MHLYGKMLKWWITKKHIDVYDVTVCIYSKQSKYMHVHMYQRVKSFFDPQIETGSQVSYLVLWIQ